MFTMITLTDGNRMVRAGFGQNEGYWFVRVDLWWVGFRLAEER